MAEAYRGNAKWVSRMEETFTFLDFTKSGHISSASWEHWVDNLEKEVNPGPSLIQNLRDRTREYCDAMGLTSGVSYDQDEFVAKMAELAAVEKARYDKGEKILLMEYDDAWYDAVDSNHDGTISLEEYLKVMKACNIDKQTATREFAVLDTNEDGRIQREELNKQEIKYWYSLEDSK